MAAPLPIVHAILICDMVIREAGSNKHSAIGIFTDVYGTQFPLTLNPLAVYACLTDALGTYQLSVELVDLNEDRILGRVEGLTLQAKEKLQTHDFGIRFVNTAFPKPGTYEFRLLADGRMLSSKKLRVRKLDPKVGPHMSPPQGS